MFEGQGQSLRLQDENTSSSQQPCHSFAPTNSRLLHRQSSLSNTISTLKLTLTNAKTLC